MKFKLVTVLTALVVLVIPSVASAATSSSSATTPITNQANSLRISPVRTDVTVDPGGSQTVTVYVTNLNPVPVRARTVVSDFMASSDESGKPIVLLDDKEYAPSHSLRRLATTSPAVVTLPPNERVGVRVTVTAPKNAMAGGYYGAVRFMPADELGTNGSNGVAVATNVGSLILMRITGPTKQDLTVASLDVRQGNKVGTLFTSPKGVKGVVRFKNGGNVQEQPFGKFQLVDRHNKVIEQIEINNTDPRGNVLPDSIRRFDVPLTKLDTFGKYTLQGSFGYGDSQLITSPKVTFYVVPTTTLIIIGVVILLMLFVAFVVPTLVRRWKRKIMAQAGKRRF